MKNNKIKLLLFFSFLFWLTGCAKKEEAVTKHKIMLDTDVSITIYDPDRTSVIDEAFDECEKYEKLFSKTVKTSEIYRLNTLAEESSKEVNSKKVYGTMNVSDETAGLLKTALHYCRLSGGAFDITIGPASELWDFTADNPVLPGHRILKEAVTHINYKNLSVEQNKVSFLAPHMKLDLGAIAKGYIADRLKEFLEGKGIKNGIINLGGNVLCIGRKPEGGPFSIGIRKPYGDTDGIVAVVGINDWSVVSSGVYERHFTLDGKNYHHILNPLTGYPYNNNLLSVTILSENSIDGDGLSTVCFSLGLDKGMELINRMKDVYAIFITEDKKLHYSEGLQKKFTIHEQ